jgi:hypothetical protein
MVRKLLSAALKETKQRALSIPFSDLLRRYGVGVGDGAANREEAREHYDRIAGAVPQDILASVIGPALGSLPPEQIETRVRSPAVLMGNAW